MGDIMEIKRTSKNILLSKDEFEGLCVLKNFVDLDHDEGDFEESPKFFTGQNDEYRWTLDVFSAGFDDEHSKYVSIRLCLMSDIDDKIVGLHFIASVVGDNDRLYSTKLACLNPEAPHVSLFKNFVLRKELLNNPKLLPNGELRIAFKIFFLGTKNEKVKPSQISQLKILGEVFDAGNYTDFKLVVEGNEFKVHRAILAARSPVFEAMFTSNMRESSEGKVEIVDVEAAVMKKLLRFVYVGDVEDFEDIADKVLVAADKYQIDELKLMCEDVLVQRLSLANVYKTLCLAYENNAENLKKKSIEFFHRNAQKLYSESEFKAHLNSLPGDSKTDIICLFITESR